MSPENSQKFAVLYPVGDQHTFAFHVCYSEGERLRIQSIIAVRGKKHGDRVRRTEDPDTWGKCREALLTGTHVIYQS